MKKYKKVVKVTKDNLLEVINVPIVRSIEKMGGIFGDEGFDERYNNVVGLQVDMFCYDQPFGLGSYFALDVCDNWHAFSEEEWNRHKNDEIETE